MESITVTFQPMNRKITVPAGTTVLEAARLAGVVLTAACDGTGRCGKCRVRINDQDRLACQERLHRSETVQVPEGNREMQIMAAARERQFNRQLPETGGYGLALDIGTTTVVGYLVDLTDGRQVAVQAALNGQTVYGADLMSRLAYATGRSGGAEKLKEAVLQTMTEIIHQCCDQGKIEPEQIVQVVLVGNTVMHHLLLGLDLTGLAAAPYAPARREPVTITAGSMGLTVLPAANCYWLPLIGGFVGADALAVVLATGLYQAGSVQLAVDIGTNGEIVLAGRQGLLATAAPAGPAFEGGQISFGRRAETGAIDRVWLDYDLHYTVIGGGRPGGLCGSALVDLLAGLLRTGLVDATGRLRSPGELPPVTPPRLKNRLAAGPNGSYAFRVAPAEQTDIGREILLSQADIRQLQLAKGAVAAGIELLCGQAGVQLRQVEQLYLAGGFGSYLPVGNAIRIGLLPPLSEEKIQPVGNGAGLGAKMCLLSREERQRGEQLYPRIKHLGVPELPEYQAVFLKHLNFPDREII